MVYTHGKVEGRHPLVRILEDGAGRAPSFLPDTGKIVGSKKFFFGGGHSGQMILSRFLKIRGKKR